MDQSASWPGPERGETVFPSQFATTFDVQLAPLPCLQHLTEDERQAHCRRLVAEIEARADAENREKGRLPMGVAAILAQDPHSRPVTTDRSPAPFVHATHDSTVQEFRVAYIAFIDAFRARSRRLLDQVAELRDMFPLWAFPPPLPFNAPARTGRRAARRQGRQRSAYGKVRPPPATDRERIAPSSSSWLWAFENKRFCAVLVEPPPPATAKTTDHGSRSPVFLENSCTAPRPGSGLLDLDEYLFQRQFLIDIREICSINEQSWLALLSLEFLSVSLQDFIHDFLPETPEAEDNVKDRVKSIRWYLTTVLDQCSAQARSRAAAAYSIRRKAALDKRFSSYAHEARCTRGQCIERCLEVSDMKAQQLEQLDARFWHNELTIDVNREIITGVFYEELDSGRDQSDLLANAQQETPVDRTDPQTWLTRKLKIARTLADKLDELRDELRPVDLHMLTARGLPTPVARR